MSNGLAAQAASRAKVKPTYMDAYRIPSYASRRQPIGGKARVLGIDPARVSSYTPRRPRGPRIQGNHVDLKNIG